MVLQDINKALVEAMKAKDTVAKALFQTFKGSIENDIKNNKILTDADMEVLINTTAKKFTENAKIMNNADGLREIELLKPFMPLALDESLYAEIGTSIVANNQATVEDIRKGNNGKVGALVGMFMKECKTRYPGVSVEPKLANQAISNALN